uniref:Uncharacterized protein n=1 Tax=virus sp. ctkyY8 TaxID=2827995 RepID=A0A8S5REI1_9VIRU|nr:MAG TPA: hypothetical protein [virus sp. ctkyY8]
MRDNAFENKNIVSFWDFFPSSMSIIRNREISTN